jgi:hypothetical protein
MHPLKENILPSQRDAPVQHQFSRTHHPLYLLLHTNHHLRAPHVILLFSLPPPSFSIQSPSGSTYPSPMHPPPPRLLLPPPASLPSPTGGPPPPLLPPHTGGSMARRPLPALYARDRALPLPSSLPPWRRSMAAPPPPRTSSSSSSARRQSGARRSLRLELGAPSSPPAGLEESGGRRWPRDRAPGARRPQPRQSSWPTPLPLRPRLRAAEIQVRRIRCPRLDSLASAVAARAEALCLLSLLPATPLIPANHRRSAVPGVQLLPCFRLGARGCCSVREVGAARA